MNKSHDQLSLFCIVTMYGQNEETEILCKAGSGLWTELLFLTPPPSDWYFSVYHDDMAIPPGQPLRLLSTKSYNHYIECSGHWRGITLTLILSRHHAVRNSRLRHKINNYYHSEYKLSVMFIVLDRWNHNTNPYLHINYLSTTFE